MVRNWLFALWSTSFYWFVRRTSRPVRIGHFRVYDLTKNEDVLPFAGGLSYALTLLEENHPLAYRRSAQNLRAILIVSTWSSGAIILQSQRCIIVSEEALRRLDPGRIAGLIVYWNSMARVRRVLGRTVDSAKLDCLCRRQELRYLERVPGGEQQHALAREAYYAAGCGGRGQSSQLRLLD